MGSPTEETWPGISKSEALSNYKFPSYSPEPLISHAPRLDSDGVSLLSSFLLFESRKRISARSAIKHQYFLPLGPHIHNIVDSESFFSVLRNAYSSSRYFISAESIFSVPGIQLSKDPGYRSSVFPQGKTRRQSMLL